MPFIPRVKSAELNLHKSTGKLSSYYIFKNNMEFFFLK